MNAPTSRKLLSTLSLGVLAFGLAVGPATVAAASSHDVAQASVSAPTKRFASCKALNATYRHGVAKSGAKDRVKGKTKPVTTFKVSTSLYNENRHLDGDGDGVACEKK